MLFYDWHQIGEFYIAEDIMGDYELVKNNYKQDRDLSLRFVYDGEEFHVEIERCFLVIKNSRG